MVLDADFCSPNSYFGFLKLVGMHTLHGIVVGIYMLLSVIWV